ncbi:hypothetical protein F4703DRAFT_1827146 [Phycomyces blakesleeanus]
MLGTAAVLLLSMKVRPRVTTVLMPVWCHPPPHHRLFRLLFFHTQNTGHQSHPPNLLHLRRRPMARPMGSFISLGL